MFGKMYSFLPSQIYEIFRILFCLLNRVKKKGNPNVLFTTEEKVHNTLYKLAGN